MLDADIFPVCRMYTSVQLCHSLAGVPGLCKQKVPSCWGHSAAAFWCSCVASDTRALVQVPAAAICSWESIYPESTYLSSSVKDTYICVCIIFICGCNKSRCTGWTALKTECRLCWFMILCIFREVATVFNLQNNGVFVLVWNTYSVIYVLCLLIFMSVVSFCSLSLP